MTDDMAPNAVSFFCLLFNILIGYSQIFPHHWIEDGCIPADEYFICISLDFIKSLDKIKDQLSEIHIEINSTASSIYVTDSYDFGNSNFGNLRDISTCFYPDIIESVSSPSIELAIYNSSNDAYVASNIIPNIKALNMTVHDDPLIFTQDWQNISDMFDDLQLDPIPETRFSLWISQSQCLEITDSVMFFLRYAITLYDHDMNVLSTTICECLILAIFFLDIHIHYTVRGRGSYSKLLILKKNYTFSSGGYCKVFLQHPKKIPPIFDVKKTFC